MKDGIIQIGGGFLLLVALLVLFDGSGLLLPLFISMAVHELGHFVAVKLFGGAVRKMRFEFIGLEMECDTDNVPYWGEIIIAVSGPLFNLVLAYAAAFWGKYYGSQDAYYLAGLSLVLGFFNSMPVRQLDGGRALYMLTAWLFGIKLAEIVVCAASCVTIFLLLVAGAALLIITGWNFTLLAFALWLLISYCKNERDGIRYYGEN